MIIKKRIFTFVFIVIMLSIITINPVSAERININYESIFSTLTNVTIDSDTYLSNVNGFVIESIPTYTDVQVAIISVERAPFGTTPGWISKTVPFDMHIGSHYIGYGDFTVTNVFHAGVVTDCIGVWEFYEWDTSGYIGTQRINITYTGEDASLISNSRWASGSSASYPTTPESWVTTKTSYDIISNPNEGFFISPIDGKFASKGAYKLHVRNNAVLHQYITYYDAEDHLNLAYYREGITTNAKITDSNNIIVYNSTDYNDVVEDYYYYPITINISNPYDTSLYWEYKIPEEVITPTETTTIQYTIVDGTEPYKYLTTDYVFERKTIDGWEEFISGTSYGGLCVVNLENGFLYRVTFTKTGYIPFEINYAYKPENLPPDALTGQIKMYPDYGSNVSVSFTARDIDTNTLLPNVKVVFNSETKYTNNAGVAKWENITPGVYTYTASVDYYETINKNINITTNTPIELPFHKARLATLQNNFVDALFPTKFVTTIYSIERKTNGVYHPYQLGTATGGFMAINLEKGYDYRGIYTADGYTTVIVNYTPFFEDVSAKIRLFPDMGAGNYTVGFKIRNEAGDLISGAKVTANGEVKYSSQLGETAFGISSGNITYEVIKEGYATSTGYSTVNSNMVILIVLLDEGLPTTTPTPGPTIDKPTNIIESLKYSYSKIFGLDTNNPADLIKTNLLFALILIMGCATLIAVITKDGIGAAIGGGFGFILTVALGLIPLWVLFTGIASVCIIVVLFKGGNGE